MGCQLQREQINYGGKSKINENNNIVFLCALQKNENIKQAKKLKNIIVK